MFDVFYMPRDVEVRMEIEKLSNVQSDDINSKKIAKRKWRQPRTRGATQTQVTRTEIETSSSDLSSKSDDSDGDDDQQIHIADSQQTTSQERSALKAVDHPANNGHGDNAISASEVDTHENKECLPVIGSRKSEPAMFITLNRDPEMQAGLCVSDLSNC